MRNRILSNKNALPSSSKTAAPRTLAQFSAKSRRFQKTWNRVIHVISKMRSTGVSLFRAAKDAGTSPATVRRWGKTALRKDKRGRYTAKRSDRLLRVMMLPTPDGPREIAVPSSRGASALGQYWAAVQAYLETGDKTALAQFEGKLIKDASGIDIPLLTDTNELNRLGSAGVLSFESLYRRVA